MGMEGGISGNSNLDSPDSGPSGFFSPLGLVERWEDAGIYLFHRAFGEETGKALTSRDVRETAIFMTGLGLALCMLAFVAMTGWGRNRL